MSRRACPLAIGVLLFLGAGAAAAGPAGDGAGTMAAQEQRPLWRRAHDDDRPRFLWGIGEWPQPTLEAERRLFGFRFEFPLGAADAPVRGSRVR